MTLHEVQQLLAQLPEAIQTLQESAVACVPNEQRRVALLQEIADIKSQRAAAEHEMVITLAELTRQHTHVCENLKAEREAGAELLVRQQAAALAEARQARDRELSSIAVSLDAAKAELAEWRAKADHAKTQYERQVQEHQRAIDGLRQQDESLRISLRSMKERLAGVA